MSSGASNQLSTLGRTGDQGRAAVRCGSVNLDSGRNHYQPVRLVPRSLCSSTAA